MQFVTMWVERTEINMVFGVGGLTIERRLGTFNIFLCRLLTVRTECDVHTVEAVLMFVIIDLLHWRICRNNFGMLAFAMFPASSRLLHPRCTYIGACMHIIYRVECNVHLCWVRRIAHAHAMLSVHRVNFTLHIAVAAALQPRISLCVLGVLCIICSTFTTRRFHACMCVFVRLCALRECTRVHWAEFPTG